MRPSGIRNQAMESHADQTKDFVLYSDTRNCCEATGAGRDLRGTSGTALAGCVRTKMLEPCSEALGNEPRTAGLLLDGDTEKQRSRWA